MQIIEFKKQTVIPARTKQDISFWGEIAGRTFFEGKRYRFAEEHALKLTQRFRGACVITASEEFVEPDESGVSPYTIERPVGTGSGTGTPSTPVGAAAS